MKFFILTYLLLFISCATHFPISDFWDRSNTWGIIVQPKESIQNIMEKPVEITQEIVSDDNCITFDNFADSPEFRWWVVNDGVMWWRSQWSLKIENNMLQFSGTIVTRGWGFSSLRGGLEPWVLSDYNSVTIRARSDERTYRLTFRDTNNSRISHQTVIPFQTPWEFEEVTIRLDELETTFFWRNIVSEAFKKYQAREIWVILSDWVDWEFKLEIDEVRFCK